MPVNAFEEDEDTNKDGSASKHPTISDNQWVVRTQRNNNNKN